MSFLSSSFANSKPSYTSSAWLTVIVKKSSPKNLSANCRSTDYRQVTNTLPTANRQVTNTLPTANRQVTTSFQNRKFVVKTRSKHDLETIIIPILIDQWYEMHSRYHQRFWLTDRTINVRKEESCFRRLSIVSLNFTNKLPNSAQRSLLCPCGMSCMYQ